MAKRSDRFNWAYRPEEQVSHIFNKASVVIDVLEKKGLFDGSTPMLSIPFLDWINSYDFSNFTLIEFGAGKSTIYFSSFFKNIISFETDEFYYKAIKESNLNNVEIILKTKEDIESGNFDLVIDDKTIIFLDSNTNRLVTAEHILNKSNPNIIILDNAEWYPNTCITLYRSGYSEIPFWGVRPEDHVEKCVSVFIKNGYQMPPKDIEYFAVGSQIQGINWSDKPLFGKSNEI
jgi:hypothetical protein